jgi:hypothetical protein
MSERCNLMLFFFFLDLSMSEILFSLDRAYTLSLFMASSILLIREAVIDVYSSCNYNLNGWRRNLCTLFSN